MKYAPDLEAEGFGDYSELDEFEEEVIDSFSELDEYSDHECESCAEVEPGFDEAEWEAEVMRNRGFPQRPLSRFPRSQRPRVIRRPRPGLVFPDSSICTCPTPDCPRHGSEYVRWVQSALNQIMNLRLPVTGIMNAATRSALRSFQEKQGLPVDGIAGPETNEALKAARSSGISKPPDASDIAASDMPDNTEVFDEIAASSCPGFTPVAVENPGGGRIKDKKIPDSSDIVVIQGAFSKTRLHRLAAEALKALVCAARGDGIKHPQLLPTGGASGFRDPKRQKAAWERALKKYGSEEKARKWVARPGFSAHQSGRAIDFYLGLSNDSRNVTKLRMTSAYKWMVANAHRFGFYPYPAEPWHWEYNPPMSGQAELFSEMDESFEPESDFEDEYGSFEYEDEFADETETGDWEVESALDVLSPSELKAVRITSTFETGRPGGFGGLSGNFDGQGLSFGLLNFTIKAGSLIPLLQEFINKHPARYMAAFGKDAARFKDIVFATKPDPTNPKRRIRDVNRQMEFVNNQMNSIPRKAKGNKIIEPWKTYFDRLENDSEFRKIQVKAVRRALDRARYWSNYFGFKTERGFAFMFDLVSSHGGAWLNASKFKGKRIALLQKMLAAKKAQLDRNALGELEIMEAIANTIADVSLKEWREKVRVRKLWFVQGRGKVHGRIFDIKKDFGITNNAPDFGSGTLVSPSASELAWERGYDGDDNQEFEQPAGASVPTCWKTEKAAHGKTIYLKIELGMGKNRDCTGIYIPNSFKADSGIVVVLYLHGHKGTYPGNSVLINGYWNGARFPFFGLREEVGVSRQNVIFVAPSLGPVSQAGTLSQAGGLDAFMKQLLSGFNEHYLMPRQGRRIEDIRSLILAAHSGGGSPMLKLAKGTDQYASKIKECWCFDSMYGPVATAWVGWAKSHPKTSLHVYYGPAKIQGRILPRDNAEAIACASQIHKLTNVCVQPSRAKAVGRVSAHFWVPKVHLKERLLNSPCLAKTVCPPRPRKRHSGLEVSAPVGIDWRIDNEYANGQGRYEIGDVGNQFAFEWEVESESEAEAC